MQVGKASVKFEKPPVIEAAASIAGKKEGEGPLGKMIDLVVEDAMFGTDSWEQAESTLQKKTALMAMEKGGLKKKDIRYLFAGDLLGQLIATSFGLMELEVPLFGLYGACSTMGESISLGAMTVQAGYADRVMAVASSHFATAEKQFRFPLAYGNQRPFSATWTVTGCGAVVLSAEGKKGMAKVTGLTTGRIVDMGATAVSYTHLDVYKRQVRLYADLNPAVISDSGVQAIIAEIRGEMETEGYKVLETLGDSAAAAGDNGAALDYYQKSLNIYPDNPQLIFDMAVVYKKMDDKEKSNELFGQVIMNYSGTELAEKAKEERGY